MNQYPDISHILARKEEARREKAALPYAEKIGIVERMRDRLRPLNAAREARRGDKVRSPDQPT